MTTQNVLLVVIDTARADVVHEMMEEGHLPGLRGLADDGLDFRNAVATSPWTLPSHASLFTGQRASDHGAHAADKMFDPEVPALAERLRSDGYRTYGISGNIWVSAEFGFDRGFDNLSMKYDRFWDGANLSGVSRANSVPEKVREFARVTSPRTFPATLANGVYTKLLAGRRDKGAANTTRRTRRWLRRNGADPEPFFYFLNYLEPHLPYEPQAEFAERFLPDGVSYDEAREIPQDAWGYVAGRREYSRQEFEALRALYKGELRYVDRQIALLVEELEAQGLRDETAIVVVGDHGENIGDHGLMDHQYCLYQTLLHVPLFVAGGDIPSRKVAEIVETRDVFPTILELAGASPSVEPSVSDNSLLDDPGRHAAMAEYLAPQPSIDALEERVGGLLETDRELDRTLRAVRNRPVEADRGVRPLDRTVRRRERLGGVRRPLCGHPRRRRGTRRGARPAGRSSLVPRVRRPRRLGREQTTA